MIVGKVGNVKPGILGSFGMFIIGIVGTRGGIITGIGGLAGIGGIGDVFWLVAPVPPILTCFILLAITIWLFPVEVLVMTFCCRTGMGAVIPRTFIAVVDGIAGTRTGLRPVLTSGVTILSPGRAVIGIRDNSSTGTASLGIIIIDGCCIMGGRIWSKGHAFLVNAYQR